MSTTHSIDLLVYPDDCDAHGHLSTPSLLQLFERALWEAVARGSGLHSGDSRVSLTIRKATMDRYENAEAGDVVTIETDLTHFVDSTFTLRQRARHTKSDAMVAEGDFLVACVDREGDPVEVPSAITRLFGARPSMRPGETQNLAVRGRSMAVDIQGDGLPILFLHGFPLDRTVWKHLIATLNGWKRIAPDLRGMGLSEGSEDGYAIPEYADDMIALLDTLHLEQVVVCGLSMGGYVAFDLIRRYRDRIGALILINTRSGADDDRTREGRESMISLIEREGTDGLSDLMIERLLGESSLAAMPRVVEHLRTMIRHTPTAGAVGALRAMRDRRDAADILGDVQVPALVVAGMDDRLIPLRDARALADQIPGAQFTQIPEAGHLTPMEQPIAVSRVVREFLEALP